MAILLEGRRSCGRRDRRMPVRQSCWQSWMKKLPTNSTLYANSTSGRKFDILLQNKEKAPKEMPPKLQDEVNSSATQVIQDCDEYDVEVELDAKPLVHSQHENRRPYWMPKPKGVYCPRHCETLLLRTVEFEVDRQWCRPCCSSFDTSNNCYCARTTKSVQYVTCSTCDGQSCPTCAKVLSYEYDYLYSDRYVRDKLCRKCYLKEIWTKLTKEKGQLR